MAEMDGGEDASVKAPTAPVPVNVKLITDTALCKPGQPTVAWSPLRRISRVEYDNTVRDLLGDTTQPAEGFVPESPMANGVYFESNTYTTVSTLVAQQYQQAAETLAQAAVATGGAPPKGSALATVLSCQPQTDACAQQFIAAFANQAFRGQLDDTESSQLFQLYSEVKAQFDFTTGIQAVITSVLESPRFLYVFEFGQGTATGGVVPLSSYEVAARLSLFLWRSVPDATLMTAAAAGQLATVAQVQAQATRMLADPKATGAIQDFTMQFMQLQGTPTLGKDTQFAAWNNKNNMKLGVEMQDETLTNVSQLVLAENGGLAELLTSTSSYVNSDLAAFYDAGVGAGPGVTVSDPALPQGETTFTKTDLSSSDRAGIFTNGGVMATQAHTSLPSSVLRGKLVREELLCDQLPPPPTGLRIPLPATSVPDGGTTRALSAAHETMPGPCISCHQYMDPIGFGFGHFDATGAYQATDANGFPGTFPPIDATGQVAAMSAGEFSTTFNGATDLMKQLAGAAQVAQCFVIQELRYALSRIETNDDACSAQQAYAAFSSSQLNVQKLLVALTGSDAFRYRSAQTPGSSCQ